MRNIQSQAKSGRSGIGRNWRKSPGIAGRVVLAAIVHDERNGNLQTNLKSESKCKQDGIDFCSSSFSSASSSSSPRQEKRKSIILPREETSNTHADKSLRKIGHLLFNRRKENQPDDEEGKVSPSLIDGTESNGLSKTTRNLIRRERELEVEVEVEKEREQVIEFKFDLIVEKQDKDADLVGEEKNSIRSKGEDELDDNVNELVESFVLDSADVCLMSVGGANLNIGYHLSRDDKLAAHLKRSNNKKGKQFDYVCELAAQTLTYSFLHLNSKVVSQEDKQSRKSLDKLVDKNGVGNNSYYSVELSATLFSSNGEASNSSEHFSRDDERFSIVDLLGDEVGDYENTLTWMRSGDESDAQTRDGRDVSQIWQAQHQDAKLDSHSFARNLTGVECLNVEEALDCVNRIRRKLTSLLDEKENEKVKFEKKLLLIGLKLKQKIHGGIFTNRLTIIEFSPKFLEFQPIFESIFNGQALSYLKRRQSSNTNDDLYHQTYSAPLQVRNKFGSLLNVEHKTNCDFWSEKQNHQVASKCERRLMQAEWILYERLSSAMIGTLIVVHVHKLSSDGSHKPPSNLKDEQDKREEYSSFNLEKNDKQLNELLMENLILLEFARSIKRASASRLKRRKRHLESDFAQSNASISTSNLSATITRNDLLRSLRHSAQTQNLLHYSGSLNARKCSLDMSSALARRHHKHKHKHHPHPHPLTGRSSAATSSSRCKKYSPAELTESSSISTSSGSQTCRHIRAKCKNRDRLTAIDQEFLQCFSANNLSDNSDSNTSAVIGRRRSSSSNYKQDIPLKSHAILTSNRQLSVKRKDADLKRLMQKQELNNKWQDNLELELLDDNCQSSRVELDASNGSTPTERNNNIKCVQRVIPLLGGTSSTVISIDCKQSELGREEADTFVSNLRDNFICTYDNKRRNSADNGVAVNEDSSKNENRQEAEVNSFLNCSAFEDQASEILSVIAEPPKQLRLEKFLNQLSSLVSPMKQITAQSDRRLNGFTEDSSYQAFLTAIENKDEPGNQTDTSSRNLQPELTTATQPQRQINSLVPSLSLKGYENNSNLLSLPVDEDDEDCKSHSSILEHLSSLALESNSKLNHISKQKQFQ